MTVFGGTDFCSYLSLHPQFTDYHFRVCMNFSTELKQELMSRMGDTSYTTRMHTKFMNEAVHLRWIMAHVLTVGPAEIDPSRGMLVHSSSLSV